MVEEIQGLIDAYQKWLKEKTTVRSVADWVEITTPYLDRHNDYIQIYAKRLNGGFVLTDDGYTIGDLALSGCKLESTKRQQLLTMTLNGFGVQLKDDALQVLASSDNFPLRKHNLVQAMLAVNDMFYLAAPTVVSLFYEDVVAWLDVNEIRYSPEVKFTGKSGFDHMFDFVIPKSRALPERILKLINRPSRETAEIMAFAWLDTKQTRPANSTAFAILNDSDHAVSSSVIDALLSYDVRPVPWSNREETREELVA